MASVVLNITAWPYSRCGHCREPLRHMHDSRRCHCPRTGDPEPIPCTLFVVTTFLEHQPIDRSSKIHEYRFAEQVG